METTNFRTWLYLATSMILFLADIILVCVGVAGGFPSVIILGAASSLLMVFNMTVLWSQF